MALNLLQDSPLNFNDLNFEFVQEESGGYFAPIDIGNGTTVTKTNSGQYEISGPQGGAIYDANGALLNSYVRTGARTGTMFDPQGNVVGSIDSSSRINEVLSDVFTPIAPAIPAILGTLALGPVGSGLLGGPAAAATAAGGNTLLFQGGDLQDALRAAALAGVTAYGIETLFPGASTASVDPDVAVDVANLAAQGVPEEQIAQILAQEGVANEVINSALDAQFGISAAGSAKGLEFTTTPSGAEQVPVASQASQAGLLSTAAPAVAPAATGLLGTQSFPVPSESVQVQTTTAPAETQVSAPVAAATGGLLAEALPSIEVTGNRVTGEAFDLTPAASLLTIPTIPTAPAITNQTATVEGSRIPKESETAPVAAAITAPTPSDRVIIEDRPIKREEAQILAPVAAGTVAGVPVADVTVPRSSTGPIEGSTTVNPLLALGLLGLAGTALGGGGSTAAPFDQAAYDAIARGRSPVYPRGEFTPISLGGLPGMGGMGEMGAYDYFGPYYGAGRFGARPQAFALPGLLGPQMMSIPTTPSRSAAV